MRQAKADGKKILIDATLGVVGRPTRRVLKQANRANATVRTQVEPVQRSAWHANQVAGFDFDRQYRSTVCVDVKKSVTRNDESDFVFVVPVFAIEFREHLFETGCGGIYIDHVGSHVAAALFERFNLARVGVQDRFGWSVVGNRMSRCSTFVVNTVMGESRHDLLVVLESFVFVENRYDRHTCYLLVMCNVRPIVSSRNSRISICRFACARVSPHE